MEKRHYETNPNYDNNTPNNPSLPSNQFPEYDRGAFPRTPHHPNWTPRSRTPRPLKSGPWTPYKTHLAAQRRNPYTDHAQRPPDVTPSTLCEYAPRDAPRYRRRGLAPPRTLFNTPAVRYHSPRVGHRAAESHLQLSDEPEQLVRAETVGRARYA